MGTSISRRNFLQLAGLLSLSSALSQNIIRSIISDNSNEENVLIIVFDAWSASNISLYGYPRRTTPNLERLAEKAIVYHNHFAGGHFTTPGTASLLTGTTSWKHRAFKHNDKIDPLLVENNIFNAFRHYHSMAYTHMSLADTLLQQFLTDIDDFTPWHSLYFEKDPLNFTLFKNDQDTASVSWRRSLKRLEEGHAYTLYLSQMYENYINSKVEKILPDFPRGIPKNNNLGLNFLILEHGIDWVSNLMGTVPQPFIGYYHFLPPHEPYRTRVDFIDAFIDDSYLPPQKPKHLLGGDLSEKSMINTRRWYDEFILYADAEFARLYDLLEQKGILENTWLILTSDHGDMLERNIIGHTAPVFHQPIIHIPLVIFPPGQKTRVDIYENTSAMDLLPTLLHVTEQDAANWVEGEVLPPFTASSSQFERDITTIQVNGIDEDEGITKASLMLVRDNYKLMWYFGYDQIEGNNQLFELYDISNDPEELHNLYPSRKDVADELINVLKSKLDDLNKSYQQ